MLLRLMGNCITLALNCHILCPEKQLMADETDLVTLSMLSNVSSKVEGLKASS